MPSFIKKNFSFTLAFLLSLTLPVSLVLAAESSWWPLVQCGTGPNASPAECNFDKLLELVGRLINALIEVITLIAVAMIVYAGFMTINEARQGKDATAYKKMLWNVILGFFFALAAYVIVKTIVDLFVNKSVLGDAIRRVFGS